MIKRLLPALTVFLLFFSKLDFSEAAEIRAGSDVNYQKRMIDDLISFPFLTEIRKNMGANKIWVLVTIEPSEKSGRIDKAIDQRTKDAMRPNREVEILDGIYRAVVFLDGKAEEKEWPYRFENTAQKTGQFYMVSASPQFIPYQFIKSNLAICSLDKDELGETSVSRCYILPLEWKNFVVPAFSYLKTHANDTFSIKNTGGSYEELILLLDDKNPLIGIAATQALIWDNMWNLVDSETLGKSNDFRLAVYFRRHLQPNKNGEEKQKAEFADFVENLTDPSKLEFIALGLSSLANRKNATRTLSPETMRFLLSLIQKKQSALSNDPELKERMKIIVGHAGIG